MPIALVLLGAQGSGKGTIGVEFANRGFIRIVMGEILEDKRKNHPEFVAKFFDNSRDMHQGDLQSDMAVEHCLIDALREARGKNVVLDGCIRSVAQAHMVYRVLIDRYYTIIFVHLDCSRETAISRVEKRKKEAIEKGIKPRPDDCSREVIEKRLDISFGMITEIIRTIQQKPIGHSVYRISVETEVNRVIGRIDTLFSRLSSCAIEFRFS